MKTRILRRFFSTVLLLLLGGSTHAADNRRITYQGRILRPDGTSLTGLIPFTLRIYSPSPSSCLLWAEGKDVELSAGAFSAEIGDVGYRLPGPSGGGAANFQQVFTNNPGLTISSSECAGGYTDYTPTATDDRILRVSIFDDGQSILAYNGPVKSIPFALETQAIGGYSVNYLFKISGGVASDKATGIFSQAGADLLWEIAHNRDFGGQRLLNLGAPTAASDAATKAYVDGVVVAASGVASVAGSAGQILVANGTTNAVVSLATTGISAGTIGWSNFIPVIGFDTFGRITSVGSTGVAGGTVTQVNSGTGLTGGPISGAGTLSLADTAVSPGTYGSANYSASFTVDQQGRLTAAGSTLISINGNQVLGGTIGLAQVPDLDAARLVSGTLANARLPLSGVTAGAFSSSSFVPSFTVDTFGRLVSVGSNAISFPALQWTDVALGLNYASGSVGIGTTTPSSLLHVNGAVRVGADATQVGLYLPSATAIRSGNAGGNAFFDLGTVSFRDGVGASSGARVNVLGGIGVGSNAFLSAIPTTGLFVEGNVGLGTSSVSAGSRLEVTGGAITAGNNGELRMMESLANGTHSVAFRAPASLLQNYSMSLPGTIGTPGQVLSTDGTGALSWLTPSTGVSFPLLSTTSGSAGTPAYTFSADADTGIFSPGSENLAITTGGVSRITVDADGEVGIGSGTPMAPLQVFFETDVVPTTGGAIVIGNFGGPNLAFDSNEIMARDNGVTSTLYVQNQGGLAAFGGGASIATSMTVGTNFSVGNGYSGNYNGVHLTAPLFHSSYPFNVHVEDSAAFAAEVGGGLGFRARTDAGSSNYVAGLQGIKENATSGDINGSLRFFTRGGSNFEKMRLNSGGSLGIGTSVVATGALLEVSGGAIRASQQSAALAGEVQMSELLANGTNVVAFRAPPSLASSLTWELPDVAGTTGQVLGLSSIGTLGWVSAPVNGGTFLAASGSAGTPGVAFNSDPDTGLFNPGANTFGISVGGTERMRLNSGGSMGLGTTNPSFFFHARKDQNSSTQFQFQNFNAGASAFSRMATGSDVVSTALSAYSSTNADSRSGLPFAGAGELIFTGVNKSFIGNFNAAPMYFLTNDTIRMTLGSLGEVGIGTMSIASGNKLEVTGGAIAAGDNSEFRFMELIGQGTNFVSFRAPGTLATSVSFRLPAADGTFGASLQTDGAGNLTFQRGLVGRINYAGTGGCLWGNSATTAWHTIVADTDCPAATVTAGATAPGTRIPGIVINNMAAGDYEIVVTGQFFNQTGGTCRWRLTDGTSTNGIIASNMAQEGDQLMIAQFSYTTSANRTFQVEVQSGLGAGDDCYVATDEPGNFDFQVTVKRL